MRDRAASLGLGDAIEYRAAMSPPVRHHPQSLQEMIPAMRLNAVRVLALLVIASALAGCDKCADNFIANPFAVKPAGTCHEGPVQPSR